MILIGNQRGGANNLADHLMKEENEHIEVHEIRGFMSQTVKGALNEIYAISRGTQCNQFMYSLSFNPPPQEKVTIEQFEDAFEKAEKRLGLSGQSRVIVFHEKEGRRHAHAVWSRIDTDEMKAIQMSYDHNRLNVLSRDLFLEHGWKMPRGLAISGERDPRNFTLADWQQAKRVGKDPREIQTSFEDAWAISDSKAGFIHAMKERGYSVARGDKKGRIVAVDIHGEIYSVPKKLGIKIKDVRARLGDEQDLQSVSEAKYKIANNMLPVMARFKAELKEQVFHQKDDLLHERDELVKCQRAERQAFIEMLAQRQKQAALTRQARFRSGYKGLWDRVRGEHSRIRSENEQDALRCRERDRTEKDRIIANQLSMRRLIKQRNMAIKQNFREQKHELRQDAQGFEHMQKPDLQARQYEGRKSAYREKRQTSKSRHRPRGPTMEP